MPSWLKFDATSGTFSGKPPEGETEELKIKVTARDNGGSEATVNFKLDVKENGNQPAGERSTRKRTKQRGAEKYRCRPALPTGRPLKLRFPADLR